MPNDPQASLVAYVEGLMALHAKSTHGDALVAPGSTIDRIIRDPKMTKVWAKLAAAVREDRCRRGLDDALFGFARAVAGAAESAQRLHAMTMEDIAKANAKVVAACSALEAAIDAAWLTDPEALDAIDRVKRAAEIRRLAAATLPSRRPEVEEERSRLLAAAAKGTPDPTSAERVAELDQLLSIWKFDPAFNPKVTRTAGSKRGRERHLIRALHDDVIPQTFTTCPDRGVIAAIATVGLGIKVTALQVRDVLEGRRNRP